ncbi:hypothetical protein N7462_006523 [Penicillium macrosclerotiorum]|uniref:uncharacterized protein n=1 Tax=Penicillium macrosclerotiorum TaxID=303699 RepID=UPI002548BEF6|nr:uncharacterized protein N7462_006523 [Penicillium macrosclerotiorum]KAJ5683358.1 hypothetical protein N7462_006523 [Penicillium macrosclerotiorum]
MARSKGKGSNILPLILLLLFVAVLAVVGFVVYRIVQDVSKNTREKMERKHMVFTKDGMKVQVKEMKDEQYKDRTQSVLVNMWNHTSFPAYKSRLWDMSGEEQQGVEKRKP